MNGFDKYTYQTLMESDPMEAQNYLDSFRFGVKPEEVTPTIQQWGNRMENISDTVYMRVLAQDFYSRHESEIDYGSPQAGEIAKLMDEEITKKRGAGASVTGKLLDDIYVGLVESGKVTPKGWPQGVSTEANDPQNPENMSTADLQKYLRDKGMNV